MGQPRVLLLPGYRVEGAGVIRVRVPEVPDDEPEEDREPAMARRRARMTYGSSGVPRAPAIASWASDAPAGLPGPGTGKPCQ